MKKLAVAILTLVIIAIIALVVWRQTATPALSGFMPQKTDLAVAKVEQKVMPLYLQTIGQAVSMHSVAIQPQVSGLLTQVFFSEGDDVKKGQQLFQIDPAPFKADVLGAKGAWQAANAKLDRIERLRKKDYGTEQEYQQAQAEAAQAKAALQTARIKLGYTRITSPITGRTGLLQVKTGNLVQAGSDVLVTIKQFAPIEVRFSLPQDKLAILQQYWQDDTPLSVLAFSEEGDTQLARGKLVFLGNKVDKTTGTITLKARFSNQKETLWPGQYLTIKVLLATKRFPVIPAVAVQFGQDGTYVYQVKDGKAVATQIVLQREQGQLALIANGLKAGDEVVVRVPHNLREGMPASTYLLTDKVVGDNPSAASQQPEQPAP